MSNKSNLLKSVDNLTSQILMTEKRMESLTTFIRLACEVHVDLELDIAKAFNPTITHGDTRSLVVDYMSKIQKNKKMLNDPDESAGTACVIPVRLLGN